MSKKIVILTLMFCVLFVLSGCDIESGNKQDIASTLEVSNKMATNQPTPTDINYSLERYNLIKRAYWVNGQREKANTLVCAIEKPLGYIALFLENGTCVGKFIVDGKVTSLNSYLTPDSEYYEVLSAHYGNNEWISDVDGSYGENDSGIFFFTPDGKYIEWTGTYLYSDIPFEINDVIVKYEEVK